MDTPIQKIPGTAENWENGTLGCDEAHARPVSPEKEKEIDDALGLERITFKVPKDLLNDLREMAKKREVVEQVIFRTALVHFVEKFHT